MVGFTMVVRPQKGQAERATLTLPKQAEPGVDHDLAVFIGRFQPFHFGHLHIIEAALKRAQYLMIIVGSADVARRPDHNPFTAAERIQMIKAVMPPWMLARVRFTSLHDFGNMPMWTAAVRRRAAAICEELQLVEPKVTLIGHSKDASSFYLKEFPEWDSIDVPQFVVEGVADLSAVHMREAFFSKVEGVAERWMTEEAPKVLPPGVIDWLRDFTKTDEYADMVDEWAFAKSYDRLFDSEARRKGWNQFFVTVDNVVVHSGHILLIQRKNRPGKDLWAVPGGHLDIDEYIAVGSLRELREETKIKVPEAILKGSIVATRVFDNPHRSMRKRTITHATLYNLVPKAPERNFASNESLSAYKKRVKEALALPQIKAADDAKKAIWVPIDKFYNMRDQMFEDHYQIIETMLALLPKE